MKVTAPNDLQGRLIRCRQRTQLITEVLWAFGNNEVIHSEASLTALGDMAEEMGDELNAIQDAYVKEDADNRQYQRGSR